MRRGAGEAAKTFSLTKNNIMDGQDGQDEDPAAAGGMRPVLLVFARAQMSLGPLCALSLSTLSFAIKERRLRTKSGARG